MTRSENSGPLSQSVLPFSPKSIQAEDDLGCKRSSTRCSGNKKVDADFAVSAWDEETQR